MEKRFTSLVTALCISLWASAADADSDYDPCQGVKKYEFLSIAQHNQFVELTWKEFGTIDELSGEQRRLVRTDCISMEFVFEGTLADAELVGCGMVDEEMLECCSYNFYYCEGYEDAEYCEFKAIDDEYVPSGTITYWLFNGDYEGDGWMCVAKEDLDVEDVGQPRECPFKDAGGTDSGCSVVAVSARTATLSFIMLLIGLVAFVASLKRKEHARGPGR